MSAALNWSLANRIMAATPATIGEAKDVPVTREPATFAGLPSGATGMDVPGAHSQTDDPKFEPTPGEVALTQALSFASSAPTVSTPGVRVAGRTWSSASGRSRIELPAAATMTTSLSKANWNVRSQMPVGKDSSD